MITNAKNNLRISTEQLGSLCKSPEFSTFLKEILIRHGDVATNASEPISAKSDSLVFISTEEHLEQIKKSKPLIIIAQQDLLPLTLNWDCSIYSTPNVSAAMTFILPFFDNKKHRFYPGIHPSALVHPEAKLGRNVSVGPNSVIGADCEIGDNCLIGPFCNLELESKVGSGSILHSHVFLGSRCTIGKNCEIFPFSSIGTDGFGFIQRPDKVRVKIPQVGKVVIGDNVEIGSGCMFDRATLGDTIIGDGSKFDNLCHVAHNTRFGKNGAFTAGFNIAGSSSIGDNCLVGGQTGIADHVNICDSVTLGARSGVTKDINQPGAYAGFPIEPMRDAVRTLANLSHLTSLRKSVSQIQKKLGLKE